MVKYGLPSVSSFPKFPVGNPAAYVLNFMSSVWKALNPEATRRRTENLRRDKEGDHSGETKKTVAGAKRFSAAHAPLMSLLYLFYIRGEFLPFVIVFFESGFDLFEFFHQGLDFFGVGQRLRRT